MDLNAAIRNAEVCPYCLKAPEKMDSAKVYGKSFGPIIACLECKAWVGLHKDGRPLGRLADAELRKYKQLAHGYFDQLWKRKMDKGCPKHLARAAAYKWLSEAMGIPQDHTHIGMMDVEQCKKVVELCRPYIKEPS